MKNIDASQLAVVENRTTKCIIAGAGSGKTHTLVETITRRLTENFLTKNQPKETRPKDILNILALTFTDRAAAELRQRLARTFAEKRKKAENAEADFWRTQAAHLDRADISTIHSYALKLVQENAVYLNLTTVPSLDDNETCMESDLTDIITDWLDERNPDLLGLLQTYQLDELKDILTRCATRLSSWGLTHLTTGTDNSPEKDLNLYLASFKNLVQFINVSLKDGAIKPDKPYYFKIMASITHLIEALTPSTTVLSADLDSNLALFNRLIEDSGRWYSAQSLKNQLREALTDLKARRSEILARPLTEKLLRLLERLPKLLNHRKKERGIVNFDDILILARRLLATSPRIRQQEILKRHLILIDEFQDTNRLQANLLAYLLLPPDDSATYPENYELWSQINWAAVSPRFNVFGDLKQSIYRFRGAEVKIMADFKQALIRGGGQVLALNYNYRSQKPLINFFNALFPKYLSDLFTEQDHQRAVKPAFYHGSQVVRLASPDPPTTRNGLNRAKVQAILLVKYLNRLIDNSGPVLINTEGGQSRRPNPGDVAVLFRRFKYANIFKETLLTAGWPCHLAGGSNPFDYAEVRGLLAAFNFLSTRNLEVSLATILRSPLGPVSDKTLLALAWPDEVKGLKSPIALSEYFIKKNRTQTGTRPFPKNLAPDDLTALNALKELLASLAILMGRWRPVEILERLVEARHLLPLAALEDDGQDRVLAITTFLTLSREIGKNRDQQPLNPAEELMELRRTWSKRRNQENSSVSQAITLLTVHGAKGLEFPVVVIAEADYKPRPFFQRVAIAGDGHLALCFRDTANNLAKPPSYQNILAEEQVLEDQENKRLLYVATTRAKDHLVFLGWPSNQPSNPNGSSSWLEALLQCPEAAALTEEILINEDPNLSSDPENTGTKTVELSPATQTQPRLNFLTPMTVTDRSLSVTTLAHLLVETTPAETFSATDPPVEKLPAVTTPFFQLKKSPDERLSERRLSQLEAGNLFHAVLEIINPLNPNPAELLALESTRLALTPGDGELQDLAARIETFIKGPLGLAWRKTLQAGLPAYRELPFWLTTTTSADSTSGQLTITGVIDLFFYTPDGGGCLVDYKLTDFHPSLQLKIYETQVHLYAQALFSAGFTGPLTAAIYFAGGRKPVIHEIIFSSSTSLTKLLNKLKTLK
ncbi:MAG: UvrD-helicase domain-containing protein [Candidatus Adiutrix intracellularis]|jgi:ATP-dependent helicase/nuclease subunit A|nr:UvrD-helicase domain-containing protein [Candidatus Adiutrix intracellularis]